MRQEFGTDRFQDLAGIPYQPKIVVASELEAHGPAQKNQYKKRRAARLVELSRSAPIRIKQFNQLWGRLSHAVVLTVGRQVERVKRRTFLGGPLPQKEKLSNPWKNAMSNHGRWIMSFIELISYATPARPT